MPTNYSVTTTCGSQWLEAEVANEGQADAGPFTSQWLLDGKAVATYNLPGLVIGGKRVFDFPMQAMTPGTHTVWFPRNRGGFLMPRLG
jgi:subtilase family serine protease